MPIFFYKKCPISILHVEVFSELLLEKQKIKKRTNIIVHNACTQSFCSSAVKQRLYIRNKTLEILCNLEGDLHHLCEGVLALFCRCVLFRIVEGVRNGADAETVLAESCRVAVESCGFHLDSENPHL